MSSEACKVFSYAYRLGKQIFVFAVAEIDVALIAAGEELIAIAVNGPDFGNQLKQHMTEFQETFGM